MSILPFAVTLPSPAAGTSGAVTSGTGAESGFAALVALCLGATAAPTGPLQATGTNAGTNSGAAQQSAGPDADETRLDERVEAEDGAGPAALPLTPFGPLAGSLAPAGTTGTVPVWSPSTPSSAGAPTPIVAALASRGGVAKPGAVGGRTAVPPPGDRPADAVGVPAPPGGVPGIVEQVPGPGATPAAGGSTNAPSPLSIPEAPALVSSAPTTGAPRPSTEATTPAITFSAPAPAAAEAASPSAPDASGQATSLGGVVPGLQVRGGDAAEAPSGMSAQLSSRVAGQVFPEVARLVTRGDGTQRITLRLQPENLGDVRVTLTVRDGSVHVSLGARSEVQQALLQGAPELHRLLGQLGAGSTDIRVHDLASPAPQYVGGDTAGQHADRGSHGSAHADAGQQGPHHGADTRHQSNPARTRESAASAKDGRPTGATAPVDPAGRTRTGVDLTV